SPAAFRGSAPIPTDPRRGSVGCSGEPVRHLGEGAPAQGSTGKGGEAVPATVGLGVKDEDFLIPCDSAGRTQDVCELQSLHAAECSWSQCSRNDRSTWRRSASESTPANGLFWRSSRDISSVPVSTSTTSSTPPSRTFCHSSR